MCVFTKAWASMRGTGTCDVDVCSRVCGVLVGAWVCSSVCLTDADTFMGNRVHLQHARTDLQSHRDSVVTKNSAGYTQGSALGISELTKNFSWNRQPLHTRNSLAQTSMGTHLDVGACRHANFKGHAMVAAETEGKLKNRKACFSHRLIIHHFGSTSESSSYRHLDECCMRVGARARVIVLHGYG